MITSSDRRQRRPLTQIRQGVASLVLATSLILVTAIGAAGQQSEGVVISGEVLDAQSRFPVSGALIELVGLDVRVLSDSLGRFRFGSQPQGVFEFRVAQLGYITLVESAEMRESEELTVWLTPKPITLEGIEVSVNRLDRRRKGFAGSVRVLDSEAIKMSHGSAKDLVDRIPGARSSPCGFNDCVNSRGRRVRLRVVIDEMPAMGGTSELRGYPASAIHSVEFVPSCATVRVYTNQFVEYMASGGRRLFAGLCSG